MQLLPQKISHLTILLFLAGMSIPAISQISSNSADFQDSLQYAVYPGGDPFFVFHAAEEGSPAPGSLTATPPGGTPDFDFTWSKYNSGTNGFDPPFLTESGTASTADNLGRGCYQVQITSSTMDLDTIFRAWVFPNDPHVDIEKSEDGKVKPYHYRCAFLRLIGSAVADTMPYYDLQTGQSLFLNNDIAFEWTSDDPEYEIAGASYFIELTIYNDPPWSRPPVKDTRFYLTIVDNFNLTRTDEVLYESIHVQAGFTMLLEEKPEGGGDGEWTESENPEEESPLEIRFRNDSQNGVEFVWSLVDSAKTGEESDITTYSSDDSVLFTYYIPGYYYPSMYAYSEAGCVDSFPIGSVNPEIHVLSSELDVMNVFTPNGDGVNDYFVVRGQSLRNFRITIYDKTGGKVYEYEHDEGRMEWQGWDGTRNGKGENYCSPGVYFYVIDALGWDATVYRKEKPYTGFVHLFRENE